MNAREIVIVAALVMPCAIDSLFDRPVFASDLCCSESDECPDGYVCRAPNPGEECSPEAPGYCGLLSGGGD